MELDSKFINKILTTSVKKHSAIRIKYLFNNLCRLLRSSSQIFDLVDIKNAFKLIAGDSDRKYL